MFAGRRIRQGAERTTRPFLFCIFCRGVAEPREKFLVPSRKSGDAPIGRADAHAVLADTIGAAITAGYWSCRSCRPNAPFAELVCLSKASIAEEYCAERSGNRWVSE
jgi:hypothetical protein